MNFEEIDKIPNADEDKRLCVTTMVVTYASDYDTVLTLDMVKDKLSSIIESHPKLVFKVAVVKEHADEKIQRNHYHAYLDITKALNFRPNTYFDILLPDPVVILIREDKTREYKIKSELMAEIGADNNDDFELRVATYLKDNGFIEQKTITVAHPNFQLIQNWGSKEKSKYKMLRYLMKQELFKKLPGEDDVKKEIKRLKKSKLELKERKIELMNEKMWFEIGMDSIDELIVLADEFLKKLKNLQKNTEKKMKYSFILWLREKIEENLNLQQIKEEIRKNDDYWLIYSMNYINYDKLIKDYFRMQAIKKPKVHWEDEFWLKKDQLYKEVKRIDDWVRDWYLKKPRPDRPKALIVIGPSRIGKTRLFSTLGPFTYICNTWNVDNWEENSPFSVFDDLDPVDELKGHNFAWFKPFFGGQDVATVTDKYRAKRNIYVGKPLVWLNNIPLEDSFKSSNALEYIRRNAAIIKLDDRPLFFEPQPREWIEGHTDYVKWKATDSWYYQNIVKPELEKEKEKQAHSPSTPKEDDKSGGSSSENEEEPLDQRKKRKFPDEPSPDEEAFEKEKGRPPSKLRREDSNSSTIDEGI